MRKSEIILFSLVMLIIFVSLSYAGKQVDVDPHTHSGTTADFAKAYPFVMLAIVALLLAVVGYFLVQRDKEQTVKFDKLAKQFNQANQDLQSATKKIDATINTLFERDHENENRLALHDADIAAIKANCAAIHKFCPVSQGGIQCLDRRVVEDRRNSDDQVNQD